MKPYKAATNPLKDCGYCDRFVVLNADGVCVSSHQDWSDAERMADRLNEAFRDGVLCEARSPQSCTSPHY